MLEVPVHLYSAAIMAADLGPAPTTGLRVQACGDCHLMNFGGFATPERQQPNDTNHFDETFVGALGMGRQAPRRLFVLAARSLSLSADQAKEAALTCARSYRKHMREYAEMHPDVWYARITDEDVIASVSPGQRPRLKARIEKALKQTGSEVDFPKLTDVVGGRLTIRDTPPLIYHPEVSREPDFQDGRNEDDDVRQRPCSRTAKRCSTSAGRLRRRGDEGRWRRQASTRCWIVSTMPTNDPLFLQVKEANASVLEPFAGASAYAHHGERVVMGQRLSQPASDMFLGWATGPGQPISISANCATKIKVMVETFDASAPDKPRQELRSWRWLGAYGAAERRDRRLSGLQRAVRLHVTVNFATAYG